MTNPSLSPQLPVIDIEPYLQPTASSSASKRSTATAIHKACRDIGFFYLCVPPTFVSQQEMDQVLQLGHEFFSLPQSDKDAFRIENSDGVRGYQRLQQNVTQGKPDHHEGFDMYAPNPYPPQAVASATLRPLEGANQWPHSPKAFQPTLEGWVDKMKVLGEAVMHAMADGLGMDDVEWEELRRMVNESFWVMRVIGYPPLPDGADGYSCGEHKDYGCLTFLLADPTPSALQVLSPPSTWLHADPLPNCFVVNIGSMWERWTAGLYPATLHRVVHRSPTYRVSVPFFFEPNFDAAVKVLPAAKRRWAEQAGQELRAGGYDESAEQVMVYGDFLRSKVEGNFKY